MKEVTFTSEEMMDFAKYCKENDVTPNELQLDHWYHIYLDLLSLEEIKQMEEDDDAAEDAQWRWENGGEQEALEAMWDRDEREPEFNYEG